MVFANKYVFSAHPPLPLHPMVPRPLVLDMYSMVAPHLGSIAYIGTLRVNVLTTLGGENSPKVTRGRVYSVYHVRLFHPIQKKSSMKPCLPCFCGRYVKGFGSLSSWSEGLLSAMNT